MVFNTILLRYHQLANQGQKNADVNANSQTVKNQLEFSRCISFEHRYLIHLQPERGFGEHFQQYKKTVRFYHTFGVTRYLNLVFADALLTRKLLSKVEKIITDYGLGKLQFPILLVIYETYIDQLNLNFLKFASPNSNI